LSVSNTNRYKITDIRDSLHFFHPEVNSLKKKRKRKNPTRADRTDRRHLEINSSNCEFENELNMDRRSLEQRNSQAAVLISKIYKKYNSLSTNTQFSLYPNLAKIVSLIKNNLSTFAENENIKLSKEFNFVTRIIIAIAVSGIFAYLK
jgi:uncharacterized FlaG/YvyC family protein